MTSDTAPKVMTFTPSKEEFKDFHRYIAYMESQGAHRAGMAKVIPPKDWKPRQSYEDIGDLVIPAPIQQVVTGQSGLFTQYNIQKKPMTVHEFRKTSGLEKFTHPRYADFEELERKFWKSLTSNPPLYGADVSGTLYDAGVKEWNMARLDTILDMAEGMKGVNTPHLFFGMWKSAFAWHTEDMDLYNITYLHYGEPKSWYVVPPEHGKRMERLARGFFPGNAQGCEAFLRHKMTLMSPAILKKYGVPYEKVTQEARQFIVTFPFGYHAGFNHGFNCAESTNFATQRWIDYGKQAKLCTCRQDIVKISMDAFVRKYQPNRYKLWKAGKDHAPIDHATPTPEAAEYLRPADSDLKENPSQDIVTDTQQDTRAEQRNATKHQRDAAEESPVGGATELCEPQNKKQKREHNAAPETPAGGTTQTLERQETHKHQETQEQQETQKVPEKKKKAKPSHKQKKQKIEVSITPEKEPVKVKPEPKKSRDAKPQTPKSHSKTTAKKTPNKSANRRRKDKEQKNGSASVEVCPPEAPPTHIQASPLRSEQGRPEDSEEANGPPQHVFQRTLSPADVLHVHSYAKGDYTEEELPPSREDMKSDSSDSDNMVIMEERLPVKRAMKVLPTAKRRVKELPSVKRGVKELPSVKRGVKELPSVKRAMKDIPSVKRAMKDLPPVKKGVKVLLPVKRAVKDFPPLKKPVKDFPPVKKPVKDLPPVKKALKDLPSVQKPVKDLPSEKRSVKVLPPVKRALKDLPHVKRAVKDSPPVLEKGAAERLKGPEVKESHLGNLPCHHPLIKDGMSDEELSEDVQVEEEEGLEGENWARPLTHLWQNKPPNLKREREYNRRVGLKAPYCCICALFWTYHRTELSSSADSPVMLPGGVMRTKPLIPEVCFTTITEEDSECEDTPLTPHLEEDGTSLLVTCSHCSVRVHASCYGVNPSAVTKEWKCARCKANAMTEKCCLCSLRGGALQRANNNKWVHVMCAVAVLEARFVNVTDRRPVDLSGIPLQRFKLKCYYCKKRMKKASGCCVQCSHGRCPTAYHPTCAQAAGVLMQPDEWPFMVYVTCCRHKGPTPIERNKAAMQDLTVGQKVICKHKNGRYYQCDVVQLSKETFYEVNFDDGSFSDNLFPEDIVSRDCRQLGPPPQGEVVQVRWTDALVYGAKFVATHIIQMYLVEFEDGSQLTTKRDDVYTLDEELPKRVKSRLSKASDMRFDGIFEEKEIIQESKRQRVINSRYRGDYIEPVIYRAIME